MTKFSKIKFILFVSCILCLVSSPVHAARLYFEPVEIKDAAVGDILKINLILDAQDKMLNAIEGRISLSENLNILSINDGGSVVSLWVQKPKAEGSIVNFSGVIPGGYKGVLSPYWDGYKAGEVLELVLRVGEAGAAGAEIINPKILLHDGEGTETKVSVSDLEFVIAEKETQLPLETEFPKDSNPPEEFEIEISSAPEIFDGKYFLVFLAQDKESGIDHYEVKEGYGSFVKAESPHPLKNQSLNKKITVKAVDKAGNFRIAVKYPLMPSAWYDNYLIWVIIIVGIIILYNIWKRYLKK
jgi:hypothetical protein